VVAEHTGHEWISDAYAPAWRDPIDEQRKHAIEGAVRTILDNLGYELGNQHFLKTPERVSKWLMEFSAHDANEQETAAQLLQAQFDDEHDSMVIVGPTTVTSMCAHHMLPVFGKAWVGYIPNGKVVGLSKLGRIVHHYAKQFTVQETVTEKVAQALERELNPTGVMVYIRAAHGCMTFRGIQEGNALTTTSAVRGVFKTEDAARAEFMKSIEGMQ
jgi:GTP cyclohydrolase I